MIPRHNHWRKKPRNTRKTKPIYTGFTLNAIWPCIHGTITPCFYFSLVGVLFVSTYPLVILVLIYNEFVVWACNIVSMLYLPLSMVL